jgi:4-alpha-glucanotransferase
MNTKLDIERNEVVEMKRQLGVDRLVLQVHAAGFPMDEDEDLGRGSPYGRGADRFLAIASRLGFDAIQLGPQGLTERSNPSPYNAAIFSRNPLDLPLVRLVDQGRVSNVTASEICAEIQHKRKYGCYAAAFKAYKRLSAEICARASEGDRASAQIFLETNAWWAVPDALYDALCAETGTECWNDWRRTQQGSFDQRLLDPPAGQKRTAEKRLALLRMRHARAIEDYALIQELLAKEHQVFRARLAGYGLKLYSDLQIGISARDMWAWKRLFLSDYRMGAPPSRTNPEGQPWGYGAFDPKQFGTIEEPGPVLRFVHDWMNKMLGECDGIRIDHPHGWIDPWVYRSDDSDPHHAVSHGARLLSSPDEPSHPNLRTFAIPAADQIDRAVKPYADRRVMALTESQIARYALLFDSIVQQALGRGCAVHDIVCEVLSTLPYPVRQVLVRHGLGRFRVAQKMQLKDPSDVYRIENARSEDWVMMSSHDTAGIWQLAEEWCGGPMAAEWGRYLAPQLVSEARQEQFAADCAARPGPLVHALFAAMLASRARHVMVFFPDLLGMTERYNRPGVINDENWMLRIPADFERRYYERCLRGEALDLRKCFTLALEARLRNKNDASLGVPPA